MKKTSFAALVCFLAVVVATAMAATPAPTVVDDVNHVPNANQDGKDDDEVDMLELLL